MGAAEVVVRYVDYRRVLVCASEYAEVVAVFVELVSSLLPFCAEPGEPVGPFAFVAFVFEVLGLRLPFSSEKLGALLALTAVAAQRELDLLEPRARVEAPDLRLCSGKKVVLVAVSVEELLGGLSDARLFGFSEALSRSHLPDHGVSLLQISHLVAKPNRRLQPSFCVCAGCGRCLFNDFDRKRGEFFRGECLRLLALDFRGSLTGNGVLRY